MSRTTKSEVRSAMREARGNYLYLRWQTDLARLRGLPEPHGKAERVQYALEYRRQRAKLRAGDYEVDRNEHGNIVHRGCDADTRLGAGPGGSRYFYDCGPCRGWIQYDTHQDAPYFGVWVDTATRRTFTYAEGDRTLVVCPTLESFRAELADMASVYGPAPAAAIGIDNDGTVTRYYDERARPVV